MKLISIHLHNFCQHRDLLVPFPSGTLGVLGGNGQGKSNIFKGVRFALTGESGNAGNKAGDLNWQAAAAGESGFVELKFEAGGEEGVLKRFVSQTRATLKHGEYRTQSSNQVTARALELCGVSKGVLENIIFVDQGKIETVLFEKPADRAKRFQQLFGTESAEKLRQLLHQEVALLTTDPVDDRIVELETQLNDEIDPELRALNDEKNQIVAVVDNINLDALNIVIDDFEEAQKAQTQLAALQAKLANISVDDAEADSQVLDDLVALEAEQAAKIAEQRADIAKDRARLINDKQARILIKAKQDLVAEISSLSDQFAELVEPTPPSIGEEAIASSRKQVAIASSEVARHQNFITTFETGDAICPTCNQIVPNAADKVVESRAIVSSRSALIAQVEGMIEASQQALNRYESDSGVYKVKVLSIHEQLTKKQAQLAEMPDVDESELADAAVEQRVKEFDDLVDKHNNVVANISNLRENLAAYDGQVKVLKEQVEQLTPQAETTIDEATYNAAKAELEKVEAMQLKIAGLDGQLKQLHVTRVKTLAELEGLKAQAGKLESKRKYKKMCERARDLLHRDVLPKSVTQRYLAMLNQGINEHLTLFGASFGCTITDELEVLCNFPGVGDKPAARLSGGLKTLLGVAFRFAVCKLFASTLGFVVLDEPTAMLDDNNVQSVVDLLQIVKGHALNAGLQLMVITHKPALLAAVDDAFTL